MSKMTIKKFRKNDYSHEEDEYRHAPSEYLKKRKEKRVEHALRTKNIDELLEAEDDYDYDIEDNNWKY